MTLATAIFIGLWLLSLLAFVTGRGITVRVLGASWEIKPALEQSRMSVEDSVITHAKMKHPVYRLEDPK